MDELLKEIQVSLILGDVLILQLQFGSDLFIISYNSTFWSLRFSFFV